MNSFMIHITLPEYFSPEFYQLIPGQREMMKDLMDKDTVQSYSLDMDRKNVWIHMEAASEVKVMDILSTFPIIKYVKVDIHELAFNDRAHAAMPDVILN